MRITYILSASIASMALLASCSTPEPTPAPAPPKVVAPQPAPAPTPQPVGNWIDWPLAKGDWVYRSDARGSIALFGSPGADASFTIRCDNSQRRIYLSRAGQTAAGANMTLRASSGLQNYPTRGTGGGVPYYTAVSLDPNDIMLDRIAFSRGRFAVQTAGLQSLAIPNWPEFTRVVEDCRG